MSRIVKASTSLGRKLCERGSNYEGYRLTDVYDNPSEEKHRAWDWCFNKYCEDRNSSGFGIISHNTFSFSVSWFFDYCDPDTGELERAMQLETAQNSYTVLLNR